jgi:hypothetical protein
VGSRRRGEAKTKQKSNGNCFRNVEGGEANEKRVGGAQTEKYGRSKGK